MIPIWIILASVLGSAIIITDGIGSIIHFLNNPSCGEILDQLVRVMRAGWGIFFCIVWLMILYGLM